MNKEYENWRDIIKEVRKDYNNLEVFDSFNEKNINILKRDITKKLNYHLNFWFKQLNIPISFDNWHIQYILLGSLLEALVKDCILFYDFHKFIQNYKQDQQIRSYQSYKKELIKILKLKKKLNKKQITRISNILEYFQIQRNNFVHNSLKGYGHYLENIEVIPIIIELSKEFKIKIDKKILENLKKRRIKYLKEDTSSIKFQDVWRY